jgi:hypothetical protein
MENALKMETGTKCLDGERLLIVDDHQKWLDTASNNAIYHGVKEIYKAKSTLEGINIWTIERPSIIITDINFDENDLTNNDGLGLLEKIFYENPRLPYKEFLIKNPNLPFPTQTLVAMSSIQNIEKIAREKGANYFLNKKNFVNDFDNFAFQYLKTRS